MPESSSMRALPLLPAIECEKLSRMEVLPAQSPERAKAAATTIAAHRQMLEDLTGVATAGTPDAAHYKPLVLCSVPPLPDLLRVYLFNMTTHLSERQEGAFRIQITLNRDKRPAHFDWSDGAFVVLAGYSASLGVYAMWDAGIYDVPKGIPFSRGCQILDSALYAAMTHGIAEHKRTMRSSRVEETVVAATSGHLAQALELRWKRSVERLVSGPSS